MSLVYSIGFYSLRPGVPVVKGSATKCQGKRIKIPIERKRLDFGTKAKVSGRKIPKVPGRNAKQVSSPAPK